VFPAATVTLLTWFACQLGAFQLALASDTIGCEVPVLSQVLPG